MVNSFLAIIFLVALAIVSFFTHFAAFRMILARAHRTVLVETIALIAIVSFFAYIGSGALSLILLFAFVFLIATPFLLLDLPINDSLKHGGQWFWGGEWEPAMYISWSVWGAAAIAACFYSIVWWAKHKAEILDHERRPLKERLLRRAGAEGGK